MFRVFLEYTVGTAAYGVLCLFKAPGTTVRRGTRLIRAVIRRQRPSVVVDRWTTIEALAAPLATYFWWWLLGPIVFAIWAALVVSAGVWYGWRA